MRSTRYREFVVVGVYDSRGNYSPTPGLCNQPPAKAVPAKPPVYSWENPPPRILIQPEPEQRCLVGVRFCWSNGEYLAGCDWALTQGNGEVIRGTLDSKSFLSRVIGSYKHRVQLAPGFDPERQLAAFRRELQKILNEILAAERQQAAELKAAQDQRGTLANAFYASVAFGKGFLYGAWGLAESITEFEDLVNPYNSLTTAVVAAWNAKVTPEKSWMDSFLQQFNDAKHRELAAALGFDPSAISREQMASAYEKASYIFEDEESRLILARFARDYVKIQNHESILEFTGGMVFEIALAAILVFLTGGTGLAARGTASSTKLLPIVETLGKQLNELGDNLKTARIHEAGKAEGKGGCSKTVELPRAKGITPQPLSAPARQKKSKNKPPPPLDEAEGRPHSIQERPGREGQYTTHNEDRTWKQYRGSGKPHGDIPRPNVKFTEPNPQHDGSIRVGKVRVRPAKPDEIPK
jgi:hypothetical protein